MAGNVVPRSGDYRVYALPPRSPRRSGHQAPSDGMGRRGLDRTVSRRRKLDRPCMPDIRWAVSGHRTGSAGSCRVSFCAFAPGGFWGTSAKDDGPGGPGPGCARALRPVIPLMLRSPAARRFVVPTAPATAIGSARHVVSRSSTTSGLHGRGKSSTDDQQVAPLDPLPCPITVVWSGGTGSIHWTLVIRWRDRCCRTPTLKYCPRRRTRSDDGRPRTRRTDDP